MRSRRSHLSRSLGAMALFISLALPAFGQVTPPPELKEFQATSALKDPVAQLKELERIKAAYPASALMPRIDAQILNLRVAQAGTLDEILVLQRAAFSGLKGQARIDTPVQAARQIVTHPKVATFDRAKVVEAVKEWRAVGLKAAADPATLAAVDERNREYVPLMVAPLDLLLATAQLEAGDKAQAAATLAAYAKGGSPLSGQYYWVLGKVHEAHGKFKEASLAFIEASLDGYPNAPDAARAVYIKANGSDAGFEALREARSRELPFHPTPFKPSPAWKGKAVLAELFTGSECPPCAAADLAFDGLLESFPEAILVVLEYHLPIPAPDPMMNPATKRRQDLYGVNSTPTVVLDGGEKLTGGGGRGMAGVKYRQLSEKIAPKTEDTPGAVLKVKAGQKDGKVEVAFDLGKPAEGVDYHLVLVQGQQEHKGGNRILIHKMVVRDLVALDPATTSFTFDLAASEKATDAYLTEFEQTSTRFKGFRFPVRRHAISREGLKVALIAQHRDTKAVLQSVLADVK